MLFGDFAAKEARDEAHREKIKTAVIGVYLNSYNTFWDSLCTAIREQNIDVIDKALDCFDADIPAIRTLISNGEDKPFCVVAISKWTLIKCLVNEAIDQVLVHNLVVIDHLLSSYPNIFTPEMIISEPLQRIIKGRVTSYGITERLLSVLEMADLLKVVSDCQDHYSNFPGAAHVQDAAQGLIRQKNGSILMAVGLKPSATCREMQPAN